MQVLTHTKLSIPPKLKPAFTKACAAIARGDLCSPDLKKLSGGEFFRAKLDYDNRLLVRFVEHAGRRACLALEVIEQHAYDRSRFLRGARVDEQAVAASPATTEQDIASAAQRVRYLHPERTEFHLRTSRSPSTTARMSCSIIHCRWCSSGARAVARPR